jgi:hypothetical protein
MMSEKNIFAGRFSNPWKKIFQGLESVCFVLVFPLFAQGADVELRVTHSNGLYAAGEAVVAEARWSGDGESRPLTVRVTRDWAQTVCEEPLIPTREFQAVFRSGTKFEIPPASMLAIHWTEN